MDIAKSVTCGVFVCKEIWKISGLRSVIKERDRGDVTNECRRRHPCSCIQSKISSYQDCACVVVSSRVPMTGVFGKHFSLADYFLLSMWWTRRTCANIGPLVLFPADRRRILHTWKELPVSWRRKCCFPATGWKDKVFSWVSHVVCNTGVSLFATYEGWNFNSGNYLFTTDTK